MNRTMLFAIALIISFLWLQPNRLGAVLVGGGPGRLRKDTLNRAEMIYAGKAKAVRSGRRATITVGKRSISGEWKIAEFAVDHVIRGKLALPSVVKVRFFLPTLTGPIVRGVYFESIPTDKRCLLLLMPLKGEKGTYELVSRSGVVFFLGSLPPELTPQLGPNQRLKLELLWATKAEETQVAREALLSLTELRLIDSEVMDTLKEASRRADPVVAGTAIASRIILGDITALKGAKELAESGRCPESERRYMGWALQGLTIPGAIPDLTSLLQSKDVFLRRGATYALRKIKSISSTPHFIKALDDEDMDVRFNALMGLAETLERYQEWAPSLPTFSEDEAKYISLWKEWWETEGKAKYGK